MITDGLIYFVVNYERIMFDNILYGINNSDGTHKLLQL
jgi:hypothetical protein